MKLLKTLGVLLGLFLLVAAGFTLGFEFIKPYLTPYLSEGLATDLASAVRPLNALEQLVTGGAMLVILNWICGLNKWLHKGVNLFVDAPLALAAMAGALYSGYASYAAATLPSPEHLGLMLSLFVLGLFWLLISVKVNLLGKHLFNPRDWDARKKKVDAVIEEVKEELGIDEADEEVKV